MTAVYDNLGVRFLYPENWTIADEQASDVPLSVTIQSPCGGFWSMHIYRSLADPQQLIDQVRDTMREEYDTLEAERVGQVDDESDAAAYEMNFYCLDLIVTAVVRGFRAADRTFLILYQAESRDFEQLEPVFRAMTLSLLRE